MNEADMEEIKLIESAKFDYTGEIVIKETTRTPCFTGNIDMMTTAKIAIGYNPVYEQEAEGLEKIVQDPMKEAFTSVMRHELNHRGGREYKGCARTLELSESCVLEPISHKLKELGFLQAKQTTD